MIEVVPLELTHVHEILPQKEQVESKRMMVRQLRDIKGLGPAWAWLSDGRVILVGGVMPIGVRGRDVGTAWTLFGRDLSRAEFLCAYRGCRDRIQWLEDRGIYKRIEAILKCGFPPGHRLVRMLGFKRERVYERLGPNNEDLILYSRTQPC